MANQLAGKTAPDLLIREEPPRELLDPGIGALEPSVSEASISEPSNVSSDQEEKKAEQQCRNRRIGAEHLQKEDLSDGVTGKLPTVIVRNSNNLCKLAAAAEPSQDMDEDALM